jgi:hypothetical protein
MCEAAEAGMMASAATGMSVRIRVYSDFMVVLDLLDGGWIGEKAETLKR